MLGDVDLWGFAGWVGVLVDGEGDGGEGDGTPGEPGEGLQGEDGLDGG